MSRRFATTPGITAVSFGGETVQVIDGVVTVEDRHVKACEGLGWTEPVDTPPDEPNAPLAS